MTYFCFVESSILSVPHMEPLSAATNEDARQEAIALMRRHDSALAAHIFLGEDRIDSILAGELLTVGDIANDDRNVAA